MRANTALIIEPAASWQRLQHAKEFFFEELDQQMKEQHRRFLEELMLYERQCFLNARLHERSEARVDQANGFYTRGLTTRLSVLELQVPRSRSGHFHPQVLPRYQRREPIINQALQQVFLLGVSTPGRPAEPWPRWSKRLSAPPPSVPWPKRSMRASTPSTAAP